MPPASLQAGLLNSGERDDAVTDSRGRQGRGFPILSLFAHGRWLKVHSGPSRILSCTKV